MVYPRPLPITDRSFAVLFIRELRRHPLPTPIYSLSFILCRKMLASEHQRGNKLTMQPRIVSESELRGSMHVRTEFLLGEWHAINRFQCFWIPTRQRLHVRFVQEHSACKICLLLLPKNIRNEISTDVRTATVIKSRCNGLSNFGPIA